MRPESKVLLSLENLDIGYPGRRLISLINSTAMEGEFIAVIGHNGTGKSTLLRTLAGIGKKLGGRIMINGRDTSVLSRKEFASFVGYVSTEQINAHNMKVYDLVALGRFAYTNWMGSITVADKRVILDSIDKVGLSDFAFRNIGELSDGERQRAMIAMVLAQDTRLLIMDEPTAFLDIKNRYEIIHLLQSLTASGEKTVILSTHDLQLSLGEADKIWFLGDGDFDEGAPEDLVLKGKFDNIFGSSQIRFRKSDGNFYPVRDENGNACVHGEGLTKQWTIRAMKRLGFRVKETVGTNEVTIYVDDVKNEWKVTYGDKSMVFNSLYRMGSWIKANF